MNNTIKRIAIICPTASALKNRFNKMLLDYREHIDECSLSQQYIQIGAAKFNFFTSQYPERLKGHSFDYVILDEEVNLTTEQKSELLTRISTDL